MEFEAIKDDIVPLQERCKLLIDMNPWKGSGLNRITRGLLFLSLEL